jgi:hypothetical protein
MGLFGGMNEDELRATGTPTGARVTYVDDTGKRREDGRVAKLKVRVQIDSGSARGREMEQAKWVPSDRLPRVGDHVQIRFDPDHVEDWAWGDAAMYAPARPAAAPSAAPPAPAEAPFPIPAPGQGIMGSGFDVGQIQQVIATAFAQGNVTFEGTSQVLDVSGDPALRAQIFDQLRAYGVDVDAMQAGGQIAGAAAVPAPAGSADDTTERLRRLDDLLEQGILTADEHREQRRRIIDSI